MVGEPVSRVCWSVRDSERKMAEASSGEDSPAQHTGALFVKEEFGMSAGSAALTDFGLPHT